MSLPRVLGCAGRMVDSHLTISDAELLRRYRATRCQDAFAQIVARHSGMVYRTCLRLVGNAPDAEDAAQAAFVILAQRAEVITETLAGWLHKVVRDVALNLLRGRARRSGREKVAARRSEVAASADHLGAVREELDVALTRLPAPLREAVVLRYLEGHDQEQAAQLAGCPRGTLSRRASEGIDKLRDILARRGAAFASTALVAYLAQTSAAAAPPAMPGAATTPAARALAEQVLASRGALPGRLALAALVVLVLALGLGGYRLGSRKPPLPAERPATATGEWRLRATLDGHYGSITAVAFSPDSKQLATGSADKIVQLWDVGQQAPKRTLSGHEKAIGAVVFSPDGTALATTGWDRSTRLWEVATGEQKRAWPMTESYAFVLAFTDNRSVIRHSWGGGMSFADPVNNRSEISNPRDYDVAAGTLNCLALSPDQKHLAMTLSRTVSIRELATHKDRVVCSQEPPQATAHCLAVAFSPDGRMLAGGTRGGSVRIWDLTNNRELPALRRSSPARIAGIAPMSVVTLQFHPSGKAVAGGMADGTVVVWDVATGRELATLQQPDVVYAMAFARDGQLLATADATRIRLWQHE